MLRFRHLASLCVLGPCLALACTTTTTESDLGAIPRECVRGIAWTPSSTRVRLDGNFWPDGYAGYERARAELSPSQLSLLDDLCVHSPVVARWSDPQTIRIQITDNDKSVTTYRAAVGNLFGRGGDEGLPVIDYGSLDPLFNQMTCLVSGKTRDWAGEPADTGTSPPWSKAPIANDDPGCIHGVSFQRNCADVWVRLKVSTVADYLLTTSGFYDGPCTGISRIRLRSGDGATELASSPVATAPGCVSLPYHFSEVGTYLVAFEPDGTSGCAGQADFSFRVSHP
jgi:hypothetical protein